MYRKIVSIIVVMFLILGLVAACAPKEDTKEDPNKQNETEELQLGTIEYEVVNLENASNETLKEWYQEKLKNEGIYSLDVDDYKYILVGGGEKPSGGYTLKVTGVEGKEDEIVVNAQLTSPSKDQATTAVITYPNEVVRIANDDRNVVLGEYTVIEPEEEDNNNDEVTVIGTYVGLIDNNSCEITVDGEPNAFRISEEILNILGNIESGEKVEFSYYENEYEQLVIKSLKKAE